MEVIVSCGKKKKKTTEPIPAYEMYISKLAKLKLQYALLFAKSIDNIYYLSGKYGLIPATKNILPYEHFGDFDEELVKRQVKELIDKNKTYGYIGNKKYFKFISRYIINIENITPESKGSGDLTHKLQELVDQAKKERKIKTKELTKYFINNGFKFAIIPIKPGRTYKDNNKPIKYEKLIRLYGLPAKYCINYILNMDNFSEKKLIFLQYLPNGNYKYVLYNILIEKIKMLKIC